MLRDEVLLPPYGGGIPTSASMVTSHQQNHQAADLDFGHAFQPPLPLIQKTTRVEVDVGDKAQMLREL